MGELEWCVERVKYDESKKTNKKQEMNSKNGLRLNIQISCSFHGEICAHFH